MMKFKIGNPWSVCLSAALFFFFAIFQMSLFNTISAQLMLDFDMSPVSLGSLSSLYFYANAFLSLPAGLLLDRYSSRFLLLIIMGMCVVSTAVFGLTHSVIIAGICRALWGMGNAFAFLGCMRLAALSFPSHRVALVMGLLITVGMLGGIVAQTPLTILVTIVDWRNAMLISAAVGLMIWLIMYVFLVDKITDQPYRKPTLWLNLKRVMGNSQNWLCSLYACSLNLPVVLLGILWGNLYLTQARYLSVTQASFVTSMIFVGIIIGSPLMGTISDRMGSRRKPMLLGALLILIMVNLIIYVPDLSWMQLTLLFFLLGFLSSAQVISFPTIAESNPENVASTAMSIVGILMHTVGALIQPLFGWLMQQNVVNEAIYTVEDFKSALVIMPIVFAFGLLIAFVLHDTRCRKVVSDAL